MVPGINIETGVMDEARQIARDEMAEFVEVSPVAHTKDTRAPLQEYRPLTADLQKYIPTGRRCSVCLSTVPDDKTECASCGTPFQAEVAQALGGNEAAAEEQKEQAPASGGNAEEHTSQVESTPGFTFGFHPNQSTGNRVETQKWTRIKSSRHLVLRLVLIPIKVRVFWVETQTWTRIKSSRRLLSLVFSTIKARETPPVMRLESLATPPKILVEIPAHLSWVVFRLS